MVNESYYGMKEVLSHPEVSRLLKVNFSSVHQKKEEGEKVETDRKVRPDIEGEIEDQRIREEK